MSIITAKKPWKAYMGNVPMNIEYFEGSMFEALEKVAKTYPTNIAFDFMGRSTTYKKLVEEVESLRRISAGLDAGIPARAQELSDSERELCRSMFLLTMRCLPST